MIPFTACVCGKKFQTKVGQKFCTSKCRQAEEIVLWNRGEFDPTDKGGLKPRFRQYLLEQADYKCVGCDWEGINPVSGKTTLTIDHIDGNCQNNVRENLKVLCPNCHSLTPNYGALNKGNGRKFRYARDSGAVGSA